MMESIPRHMINSQLACYLLLFTSIFTSSEATQMIDSGIEPVPENMVEGLDVVSPDDAMSLIKRKYLWFGPRLGRKKRTLPVQDDESQFDRTSNDESVIEFIKESPWALVPLKGSTRNTLSFTPRLGRDSEEENEHSRSPPFAPRLGRRRKVLPFSPRLGRELVIDPNTRFTRSVSSPNHHNNETH